MTHSVLEPRHLDLGYSKLTIRFTLYAMFTFWKTSNNQEKLIWTDSMQNENLHWYKKLYLMHSVAFKKKLGAIHHCSDKKQIVTL